MLLREHFRMLTLALLRPLEGLLMPCREGYVRGIGLGVGFGEGVEEGLGEGLVPADLIDPGPVLDRLAGCVSAVRGGPMGRVRGAGRATAGAGVVVLPSCLCVGEWREVVLPSCLCVGEWREVVRAVGLAEHFQVWCRWRRAGQDVGQG